MQKMRLKAIKYRCDFRCNEVTLYNEFKKHKSYPGELRPGECYLFVSGGEDQIIWFLGTGSPGVEGREWTITDSRKWRLSGGSWNPMMLQNYAAEAGIELIGIRKFEEQYRAERARKHTERLRHQVEMEREAQKEVK